MSRMIPEPGKKRLRGDVVLSGLSVALGEGDVEVNREGTAASSSVWKDMNNDIAGFARSRECAC